MNTYETQISQAALIAQDWKSSNEEDSMPAKHMQEAVKLSLVKSDNNEDTKFSN